MPPCIQPKFSIAYYANKEFAHIVVYNGESILHGQTYTDRGVVQSDKIFHVKQIYTREYSDVLPSLAQKVIDQCASLGFPRHHLSIRTTL